MEKDGYLLNLSVENAEKLQVLLNKFDESELLQFCIINEIFEDGMEIFLGKYKSHDSQ